MKPIGVALTGLVYDNFNSKEDADYLRNHPGNSIEAVISAASRIARHHSLARLSDDDRGAMIKKVRDEFGKVQVLCESPLERTMLAALMMANWHFLDNPFVPVVDLREKGKLPDLPVLLIPQFPILRYRLDLAVAVKWKDRGFLWAVECDGAEFHNPDADRERDANLKALGIRTFRFTGTEIFRNPMELADSLVANMWFELTHR